MPLGVILHGTRSGKQYTVDQEFAATVGWVSRGTDGTVGWHATVGNDAVSSHLHPTEWGWNAREHSREYLAVEFAQATAVQNVTDGQVRAFVWWFINVARPVWPSLPAVFVSHAMLPAGKRDGKTDVHAVEDPRWDDLLSRIAALL